MNLNSLSLFIISLLQILANQAASAIENARLFEQTQAALSEVESTHRTYLQREWQDYLQQRETLRRNSFLYDQSLASAVGPAQVTAEPDLWRPEMERALAEGQPATTENNGESEERTGLAVQTGGRYDKLRLDGQQSLVSVDQAAHSPGREGVLRRSHSTGESAGQ